MEQGLGLDLVAKQVLSPKCEVQSQLDTNTSRSVALFLGQSKVGNWGPVTIPVLDRLPSMESLPVFNPSVVAR